MSLGTGSLKGVKEHEQIQTQKGGIYGNTMGRGASACKHCHIKKDAVKDTHPTPYLPMP